MPFIERSVQVTFRHRVFFTERMFDVSNTLLRDVLVDAETGLRSHKTLVVMDEGLLSVMPRLREMIEGYLGGFPELNLVCPPLVFEGGERTKNSYFQVSEIHSQIERYHIDRHSCMVVIGGGALLDMAGLAAATAHRGVRLLRIPTTTLSQDDSGVGVKNGINAFGKKNFIGTFAVPFAVINDFEFIRFLPARDKTAGYAEAVKVAAIRDPAFFEQLEKDAGALASFEPDAMKRLIHRCAELHMNHIAGSGDPFEMGSARPLDFGHWSAHKLEPLSDYRLRHGEAVAVGIALDVIYSRLIGLLNPASAERVLSLLENLGFELFTRELLYEDDSGKALVLQGLGEFQEHLGGDLTITLLEQIGKGIEVHEMREVFILQAIQELKGRHFSKGTMAATVG